MIRLDDARVRAAETIFRDVIELPPDHRAAVLEDRCGSDVALRTLVERLILVDSDGASGHATVLSSRVRSRQCAANPGRVGQFEIIREIGRGGVGIVYEAQQQNPRRRVALKLLRYASPSPELFRRFQLEAEALGRLNHVGIAQVFDAGVVDIAMPSGGPDATPFVAMELVEGTPLCDYADASNLSISSRLELLATICDAVQHAHQKGVIHRDLKPGNILVVQKGLSSAALPRSQSAQPKILDFGVARLMGPDASPATFQTSAGQILGTLAYMSPEQLAGDSNAVDTRSDVYSLGIVAYELLVGCVPIEISGVPLPQAIRTLAEITPPRAAAIRPELRGDIDAMLTRAMEKSPERRYASAAEFAADIRRHLRGEPITARPIGALGQLARLARRNRALVFTAGIAIAALLIGTIGTATFAWRAVQERQKTALEADRAAKIAKFLSEMLASVDPQAAGGGKVTVREVLDAAVSKINDGELAGYPDARAHIQRTLGETYLNLGYHAEARDQLDGALVYYAASRSALDFDRINTARLLGQSHHGLADFPAAERAFAAAHGAARTIDGGRNALLALVLNDSAACHASQDKFDDAEVCYRLALELRTTLPGIAPADRAQSLANLGTLLLQRGRMVEAEPLLREALQIRRAVLRENDPQLANVLRNLGQLLCRRGDVSAAEDALSEALRIDRQALDPEHPELALSLNAFAFLLKANNRLSEAIPLLREALAIQLARSGPDHPDVAVARMNLAHALGDAGELLEARAESQIGLDILRRRLGPRSSAYASGLHNEAVQMNKVGDSVGAEPLLREALAIVLDRLGEAHESVAHMRDSLGVTLIKLERHADALPQLALALEVRRTALGEFHDKTALTRAHLAQARLHGGDPMGAIDAARGALPVLSADAGMAGEKATAQLVLADALRHCDAPEAHAVEAEQLLSDAAAIRTEHFGECSREVEEVMSVRESWRQMRSP